MSFSHELQTQLEHQARQMIETGMPAYEAYMAVYHISELFKSYLLSIGREDWKEFWKISYYLNSRAGDAMDAPPEGADNPYAADIRQACY